VNVSFRWMFLARHLHSLLPVIWFRRRCLLFVCIRIVRRVDILTRYLSLCIRRDIWMIVGVSLTTTTKTTQAERTPTQGISTANQIIFGSQRDDALRHVSVIACANFIRRASFSFLPVLLSVLCIAMSVLFCITM
jgi:hypothetical protein